MKYIRQDLEMARLKYHKALPSRYGINKPFLQRIPKPQEIIPKNEKLTT